MSQQFYLESGSFAGVIGITADHRRGLPVGYVSHSSCLHVYGYSSLELRTWDDWVRYLADKAVIDGDGNTVTLEDLVSWASREPYAPRQSVETRLALAGEGASMDRKSQRVFYGTYPEDGVSIVNGGPHVLPRLLTTPYEAPVAPDVTEQRVATRWIAASGNTEYAKQYRYLESTGKELAEVYYSNVGYSVEDGQLVVDDRPGWRIAYVIGVFDTPTKARASADAALIKADPSLVLR